MATDSARAFLDDLCNNAALRTQFNATGSRTLITIMDFALSKGYVFSEKDLRTTLAEYPEVPIVDQMRSALRVARSHSTTATH